MERSQQDGNVEDKGYRRVARRSRGDLLRAEKLGVNFEAICGLQYLTCTCLAKLILQVNFLCG
jgi:hypothetical protein